MTQSRSKLIIVILYNTGLYQSPTAQSLIACAEALGKADKIFLWDNSPAKQPSEIVHRFVASFHCGVEYHHDPSNPSLAFAYNETVRNHKEYELVFFFDQDSGFDQEYFEKMNAAELPHPGINLFLPLIYSSNTIVSPGHFYYFKGRYWSSPRLGIVPAKNNVAITSGMVVRMSYLERFGKFEERLKLYGIDTNFMIRYAKQNEFFYVVSVKFDHDLSDFKTEDSQVKKMRFDQFKQSSIINSALFSLPVQWLTRLFLWYRQIQNKFRHG